MKEFDESKHQRDSDGKFTSGGGGDTPAEVEKLNEIASNPKNKKTASLLGEEYEGFSGVDAINKLIKEQKGHIKGAFVRNEIGNIDLVYGNDNAGLAHIIKRRREQGIDTNRFLTKLPDIISNGNFKYDKSRKRYEIEHEGRVAIISPKMFDDDTITWLLTAYEEN